MTILIVPGTHCNGERYYAVGPVAFRTQADALAFMLDLMGSL